MLITWTSDNNGGRGDKWVGSGDMFPRQNDSVDCRRKYVV